MDPTIDLILELVMLAVFLNLTILFAVLLAYLIKDVEKAEDTYLQTVGLDLRNGRNYDA